MKLVKFLFVSFVVLVSFTSCYDEYTNDYETPNMGFAVANPLRTVIADRKVCQNAHLLFFTHKAPTFTSWGFVIT